MFTMSILLKNKRVATKEVATRYGYIQYFDNSSKDELGGKIRYPNPLPMHPAQQLKSHQDRSPRT